MASTLLAPDFLQRIERLHLISRKIFRGRTKGERRSKRRGYSSEFADYRNYVEGDDLRFIDWNIYGRLDKLFLKLFLEEEDLHVHLLIDTSLSMNYGAPQKLDYAKQVAAAIGYIGLCNMDRVQVHAFGARVLGSTGGLRSKKSAWQLFEFIEGLQADGRTDLNTTCRQFSQGHTTDKGVVILLSDFLDPAGYEDGLRCLIGQKMDVYAVQILGADEVQPPLSGDLRLVDAETGTEQEITVTAPLLAQYQQTLSAFREGLHHFCTARNAAYCFSHTGIPFDQLVLSYLRENGLLS